MCRLYYPKDYKNNLLRAKKQLIQLTCVGVSVRYGDVQNHYRVKSTCACISGTSSWLLGSSISAILRGRKHS